MAARGEAFVEYQRPGLSGRTHKSSLDLPAPPACGRSSPDMRPARWSSHGHIRFRRDDLQKVSKWPRAADSRLDRAPERRVRLLPSPEAAAMWTPGTNFIERVSSDEPAARRRARRVVGLLVAVAVLSLVDLPEVRRLFPRVERGLGHTRAFWTWILEWAGE